MSLQLSMFASTTPSSSSLLGITIRLRRADSCCDNIAIIGSSKAMHAASLTCATCGKFRGWLSLEAADFITTTRARFGAPETITLRSSPGAGGEGHDSAPPKKEGTPMYMGSYSAKHYIKLDDVADGPIVKTITKIEEGSFDKPEATFDDGSKLSLNRTSVLVLGKVLGWESSDWIGRRVEIYAGEVSFKGTTKPGVLVRPIDPPAPKKPVEELNDEIAF